jgi:hypothetical protein
MIFPAVCAERTLAAPVLMSVRIVFAAIFGRNGDFRIKPCCEAAIGELSGPNMWPPVVSFFAIVITSWRLQNAKSRPRKLKTGDHCRRTDSPLP